jgi:hypothetical protein
MATTARDPRSARTRPPISKGIALLQAHGDPLMEAFGEGRAFRKERVAGSRSAVMTRFLVRHDFAACGT